MKLSGFLKTCHWTESKQNLISSNSGSERVKLKLDSNIKFFKESEQKVKLQNILKAWRLSLREVKRLVQGHLNS